LARFPCGGDEAADGSWSARTPGEGEARERFPLILREITSGERSWGGAAASDARAAA